MGAGERKPNNPTFGDFFLEIVFFLKESWDRFVRGKKGKLLGKYIDGKGVGL